MLLGRCEGFVAVGCALARLALRCDLLSEHFTLFGANEPRVERTVLEQVDNDDVEEDDRADLSQTAHYIVRYLLNSLLNQTCFLFEQIHGLVELVSLHLLLHLVDRQPDQCAS